jgi:hypothetical protein
MSKEIFKMGYIILYVARLLIIIDTDFYCYAGPFCKLPAGGKTG